MTHNDRDKGGHKAHNLEASRIFSFSILPRVPLFFSYDRAVYMRNAYGPKTTGGRTTYGKEGTGGASKVPLMGHRKNAVLSFFM